MNLKNISKETQVVHDAGDGRGRTVPAGELADPPFTAQACRELLASFPAVWGKSDVQPKKSKKAGDN